MASNITVDTLTKGSTTLNTDEIVDTSSNQICKAWVNFNGSGTVAIRDSYNVSSITDNGTGDYRCNFTSSLGNANYSVTGSCESQSSANTVIFENHKNGQTTDICYQTSGHRFGTRWHYGGYMDNPTINVMYFGD